MGVYNKNNRTYGVVYKRDNGFTLIELMIAVAIIGILTSVAWPSYNNYVTRAKFTELITETEGYRKDAIEHYAVNGSMPRNQTTSVGSDYVRAVEYWTNSGGIQMMHIYTQNFYDGWSSAQALLFRADIGDGSLSWNCCQHSGFRAIESNYLPSQCRDLCW